MAEDFEKVGAYDYSIRTYATDNSSGHCLSWHVDPKGQLATCPYCHGSGVDPEDYSLRCPECDGEDEE